jgi:FAD/FMN-containing dehydrogenase
MIEALNEIFSSNRVKTDADSLAHWGRDWTRNFKVAPRAVVFPDTVEEVTALVRWAGRTQIGLVPSGGRTGLSGGAVAGNGEVVVSFDRMNRILAFDPVDHIARCQAGVVTQQLQEYAKARDLFYPVDFASAGSSQIGGNVSTNAGGIKVIRYGMTRNWVAGLKVVTGTGEVLDLNRGLVKNATGYDLRHLFVGAEGTLGFVVEAEMQLAPLPDPQSVMVLGVPRLPDVLAVLGRFREIMPISAFEFFSELALQKVTAHRKLKRPLAEAAAFYALVEFDRANAEAALTLFEDCVEKGWVTDAVLSQSDAQAKDLWQLREGISESIAPYTPYKNDVSVRIAAVPRFLEEVDAVVRAAYPDFEVCWYGHIGDGNLHLNILKPAALDGTVFYERCHHISPRIFEIVERHGGSISAEHGVGLLKRDFLAYTRSPAEIAAMRALKQVFDPHGIMNPGKLFPS